MDRPVKIALSKGRVMKEALPLLAQRGLAPAESLRGNRKLILASEYPGVEIVIIRGADVPTYVEYGAAELGIVGKDVLMEYAGAGVYEYMDLGVACCRLMVAGRDGTGLPATRRVRVATKYVNSARGYFAAQGRQVEVIKLYGSMELAPLTGLSDLIVDLVDTGGTLAANGLTAREEIAKISARLIVNKAAMKMRNHTLARVTELFRRSVDAGKAGDAAA